jgi:hypothetical protein
MLIPIINDIAVGIKRGEVKSGKGVIQKLALINENSHWSKFNYPANFLKHADPDPREAPPLDKLNNDMLLMSAIAAYIELMGTGRLGDGQVRLRVAPAHPQGDRSCGPAGPLRLMKPPVRAA